MLGKIVSLGIKEQTKPTTNPPHPPHQCTVIAQAGAAVCSVPEDTPRWAGPGSQEALHVLLPALSDGDGGAQLSSQAYLASAASQAELPAFPVSAPALLHTITKAALSSLSQIAVQRHSSVCRRACWPAAIIPSERRMRQNKIKKKK